MPKNLRFAMRPHSKNKIRLFVETPLTSAAEVDLSADAAHYLCNVMRLNEGDTLSCFNAADGEYDARIIRAGKKIVVYGFFHR